MSLELENRIRQAKPNYIRVDSEGAKESIFGKLESNEGGASKRRRARKITIAFAAAAAAIGCVIGSGFLSPAMASALNGLPLIGGLFGEAGDAGLKTAAEQGLIRNVNQSVTHDGVTFTISDMMYDGTRISMVLTRETSDGKNPPLTKWNDKSTDEMIASLHRGETPSDVIEVRANGVKLDVTRHLASDILRHNSSILTIQPDANVTGTSSFNLPDSFDLEVKLQDALIGREFKLTFPVEKTTSRYIVLDSSERKSYGDFDMSINKLEMTEATMQMEVLQYGKTGQKLQGIGDGIYYDIQNEQGETAVLLGGSSTEGAAEGSQLSVLLYEPFKDVPQTIVVKPYFMEKTSEKTYVKELEFTLSVPQQ